MAIATSASPAKTAERDDDFFEILLRLRLRHGHLARTERLCRSLGLVPLPATIQAIQRLGLVARATDDGFVVLVTRRQRPSLGRWLESVGGGPLHWRLIAREGSIWGCTAVPVGARCREWHLYGSNAEGQLSGPLHARLLAVKEQQIGLAAPKSARSLQLLNGRGQLLQEKPLLRGDAGAMVVDLQNLPEGWIQPSFGGKRNPEPFLHLSSEFNAIGLVSLWLPAAAVASSGPLEFSWALPGRETIWHYLVVPRDSRGRLEELAIQGEGCVFKGAPEPETLEDGRQAWRLVGDRPLPLLERSPLRFRLEGHRLDGDGQRHRLLINPLPLAPSEPVWPGAGGDSLVGVSEIVVSV